MSENALKPSTTAKRSWSLLILAAVLLVAVVTSFAVRVGNVLQARSAQLDHLVAVSWGDGKYGAAFYGAYVYYELQPSGKLTVYLSVRIGRASPRVAYGHDPRRLGFADSPEDAVAKWGAITWSAAGLTVGTGDQAYLFPRHELERHR